MKHTLYDNVTVRFTHSKKARLQHAAAEEGITLSQLVREASLSRANEILRRSFSAESDDDLPAA